MYEWGRFISKKNLHEEIYYQGGVKEILYLSDKSHSVQHKSLSLLSAKKLDEIGSFRVIPLVMPAQDQTMAFDHEDFTKLARI